MTAEDPGGVRVSGDAQVAAPLTSAAVSRGGSRRAHMRSTRSRTSRKRGKVQKILALERRAARLRARYEGALARVASAKHKAEQCCQEARAIEATLTPQDLAALRARRAVPETFAQP